MPLFPSKSNPANGDLPDAGPSTIELRREALYNEVWTTPVSHLTKKYGLTDYRFRKICKKLCVPTPPAGYWAKRRHGHDVQPIPLPTVSDDVPDVYVLHDGGAPVAEEASPSGSEEAASGLRVPEVHVSKQFRRPHPLVARARDALKKSRPDRYGRVRTWEGLAVSVCPESIGRALRLLDALVKAAEKLSWEVQGQCNYSNEPCFKLLGEKVAFRLMERVRQERRKSEDRYAWRKYEYFPTGRLRLEITSSSAPRSKWTDGKTGPALEELLGAFLEGVYEAARAAKKWRKIREEEERKRQEAERRRLEAKKRREAEAARRRALEAEAESWQKSQKLRAYILEVERRARGLSKEEKEAFDRWLAWAEEHAERLDPLSQDLPFTKEGLQRKGPDEKLGRDSGTNRATSGFSAGSSYWRGFR